MKQNEVFIGTEMGYRFEIRKAENPRNPIEDKDCYFRLYCWHDTLTLGLKHNYTKENFFNEVLLDYVPTDKVWQMLITSENFIKRPYVMDDVDGKFKIITSNGKEYSMEYDRGIDMKGQVVSTAIRLGAINEADCRKLLEDYVFILDAYLNETNGKYFITTNRMAYSIHVGYVIVDIKLKNDVLNEVDEEDITTDFIGDLISYNLTNIYGNYINGDVYHVRVTRPNGTIIMDNDDFNARIPDDDFKRIRMFIASDMLDLSILNNEN